MSEVGMSLWTLYFLGATVLFLTASLIFTNADVLCVLCCGRRKVLRVANYPHDPPFVPPRDDYYEAPDVVLPLDDSNLVRPSTSYQSNEEQNTKAGRAIADYYAVPDLERKTRKKSRNSTSIVADYDDKSYHNIEDEYANINSKKNAALKVPTKSHSRKT